MLKRAIAALAITAATSGCMQYLVQPPQPSLAGTPQTVEAKSYAGGTVQQPGFISADRCKNGEQLGRVLVKRNFFQGLVSWITLGLIAPATIEYSCANAGEPPMGGGAD
jgi:ABC-type transport system substrate-binding protein